MEKLVLGFAPTRRFTFSAEDAQRFKKKIVGFLHGYDEILELVDIDDVNPEGLLYDSAEMADRISEKFLARHVDAVFVPHCNFGTEDTVAKVCSAVGKPVLLWGPRDEDPLADGFRLRDTQCGLFATGKVLRRFNVPFTYIPNTAIDDPVFRRGFENFLRAANVVKAFGKIRILQIGPRPSGFWSVICNEGELIEKFGVQIYPISIVEIQQKTEELERSGSPELLAAVEQIKNTVLCAPEDEDSVRRVAALKLAMRYYVDRERCTAVAIQCWNALQDCMHLMPCLANALLTDEGIPVACETDINGSISEIMAYAAALNQTAPFLCDLTVRQTTNDNAELLTHCGNFPPSLVPEGSKTRFGNHFLFDGHCPGTHEGEIKGGELTLTRFDGDHGEYQLFMGKCRGTKGKFSRGTYLWVEVNDWPLWETRLVEGPYIHHCAGVHQNVVPALYEACKYIPGLAPDPVDPTEEEIKAWLRGSVR